MVAVRYLLFVVFFIAAGSTQAGDIADLAP